MSFGFKNIGTNYQYLVNKIFKNQIRQNMEIYVDDMLVKSKVTKIHVDDLRKAFANLWKCQMKLNPTKYTYKIASSKFFGFMVSNRVMEDNPRKIKAIYNTSLLRIIKDVQCLIERIAALNWFILKLAE